MATINGTPKKDLLTGTPEAGSIFGLAGSDRLSGNQGNDRVFGGRGEDSLFGGVDDTLRAFNGSDRLSGGTGNDRLFGGIGSDRLNGGDGNDTLTGSSGLKGQIDTLTGAAGSDLLILGDETQAFYDDHNSATAGRSNYALVTGFNTSNDVIQLNGTKNDYVLAESPNNLPDGTAVYLDKPNGEPDELIGIIQGSTNLPLFNHSFLHLLDQLELPWIVAIRSNHRAWIRDILPVSYSAWNPFERKFSDGTTEKRYCRETIVGKRSAWQYWTITTDPKTLPVNSTWLLMSHIPEPLKNSLGNLYGMRTWIEYGFKQCKNELGWADFRLRHYIQIARWGELVSSAYLMVGLQFHGFGANPPAILDQAQLNLLTRLRQHCNWHEPHGWQRRLNDVQLLIQPFILFCMLKPWLAVFEIPSLQRGFAKLIHLLNQFPGWFPTVPAASQRFSSA